MISPYHIRRKEVRKCYFFMSHVLFDFLGGFCSFMQMTVDAVALGKPIIGDAEAGFNIVKFMLSVFSMVFDMIE